MPVLPQAFWYHVDGKLKQVFFEEAQIPKEKRDALYKHLQRTRNYAGGAGALPRSEDDDDQTAYQHPLNKERIYGWYPPAKGAQFMSVAQARLDKRVLKPNDCRAVLKVPDDRLRQPISTQVGPDGIAPVIPPFATDPFAYRYSAENTSQLHTTKAAPDFDTWRKEEAGRVPQWNEVVSFHGTDPSLERPQTVAVVNESNDMQAVTSTASLMPEQQQYRRPVTQPATSRQSGVINAARKPLPTPTNLVSMTPRKGSGRAGFKGAASNVASDQTMTDDATSKSMNFVSNAATMGSSSVSNGFNNNHAGNLAMRRTATMPVASSHGSPSLREIQEMQKKLSADYRWRFHVQGDPFAVKAKARPVRPAHWMHAKVEQPKPKEKPIHYSDATTFFYNTIPIIPLSFSVGPGLISERVIRDREAKQKYAPKSTPDDRYFVPAFIY